MAFLNINKYNLFMRQIRFFICDTALEGGGVYGCAPETIKRIEIDLGKPLPLALKTWYLYFGNKPPAWRNHDADYSIEDLYRTQEVAQELFSFKELQWERRENILSFSSSLGEQLLFLDITGEDDPSVYHYMEEDHEPTLINIAFTAHIRNAIIGWFEGPIFQEEYSRVVIRSKIWRGLEDWQDKKGYFDTLYEEARLIRKQLAEDIHQKDQKRGFITSPMRFQKLWVAEFSKRATWIKFQEAGLRMPYGWICPPKLKKSDNKTS